MSQPLVVTEEEHDLDDQLDREINAFNVAATGYDDAKMLRIAVRDQAGALLAGLSGWTWGGCGYIDLFWIRADQRGGGLGSRMLAAAEREIRDRGCGQVALSTHSFQAPGFYAKAGYTECGRTPAYPRGYDHIHLIKRLASRSASEAPATAAGT